MLTNGQVAVDEIDLNQTGRINSEMADQPTMLSQKMINLNNAANRLPNIQRARN